VRVRIRERSQVASVTRSSPAASAASQGASAGTFSESEFIFRRVSSTSTSEAGLSRGIVPE
jgi:hypothetical protein